MKEFHYHLKMIFNIIIIVNELCEILSLKDIVFLANFITQEVKMEGKRRLLKKEFDVQL